MRKQSSFNLESFFMENRGRAVALANGFGGGKIDPEEATSTAWVGFVRKVLNEEIRHPGAYLRKCIYNAVMDALEVAGHSVTRQIDDMEWLGSKADDPDPPPSGPCWPSGLSQPENPALSAALSKLPLQQRAVIILWAEVSPPPSDKEIGKILNISSKAVNTHRSRAIKRLRKEMSDQRAGPGRESSRPVRSSRWKEKPDVI